jgi:rhodanese-related sulfurtransferase
MLLAALAFAVACGGGPAEDDGEVGATTGGAQVSSGGEALPEPDVDGAEAQRLVAEGAFLLDITMSPRSEESELPGRTNIPLNELEARMDEVPRDRPVVVYCYGGRGSPRAAQMLRDAGYTNVHLLGAMSNWETGASDGESCAGYSLGDACITEDNFAQCQEMEQRCPGEVLALESCPLQFACPE